MRFIVIWLHVCDQIEDYLRKHCGAMTFEAAWELVYCRSRGSPDSADILDFGTLDSVKEEFGDYLNDVERQLILIQSQCPKISAAQAAMELERHFRISMGGEDVRRMRERLDRKLRAFCGLKRLFRDGKSIRG